MNRWSKTICTLLTILLTVQSTAVTVSATQLDETEPVLQEPSVSVEEAVEEVSEETALKETVPAEEAAEISEVVEQTPVPVETEPAYVYEATYQQIPLYLQTDYPDTLYGAGTIATSGCSVTCLAMVATYMTGHEYMPDELARYFGGTAENNMERLENGSEALQLPFRKAKNWHDTLGALREGKVAIVLMDCTSLFTLSQHFLVLTGLNEDGKIMVNDPYEPNYEKWDLKDAFHTGFDEGDILLGYSGAWIYDKSAMPEEPFIYSEPELDKSQSRYGDIQLTQEETRLLASVIWVEARGECDEGQQAVAEVILNRLAMDGYPDTLKDVIYADGQFISLPYLDDAEPYQAQYDAIDQALYGTSVLPMEVVHFGGAAVNDNVWGRIGGHTFCYDWGYTAEAE